MEQMISNLGITGIGFAFMYIMLKQTFKMQEVSIEKLCCKIDRLIEEIHASNLKDIEKVEQSERYLSEVTTSYIKISNKIDAQNIKIDSILSLTEKINGQKIALGMVAINKGYITREQLQDCLMEQKKMQQEVY